MRKKTQYLIIGIGIVSILAGIYSGTQSGDFTESISGIFIGIALIGTVLIERNKKDEDV